MSSARSVIASIGLMASLGLLLAQAPPQEHDGAAAAPDAAQMQEMMAKWMATMSPGEHHKKLEPLVGEWNTTTKVYWGGPGTPAMETTGTTTRRWVLDGRFLLDEHKGEMMMPDASGQMSAKPHAGMGFTGYDNYRNVYVGTWADNMGTHILTMKGGMDPSGKMLTQYGEMDEPMLGITGRMVKYVTRIIDNDKHVFEVYDLHAGPEYKVVEVTYERRK